MPAPQRIKDLVENFKANFDHVQSNDYKEEDLRNNYLNPFFQELGWDMEDRAGKGPLRDLHYEKTIKSGAPDYGFYTDGKLRFFVEAKNPSKNVCNDPPAALQLRGYGWSAKTARGILTDFEELSIYDTTVRPKAADQARVARLDCIKYTEFVERWDEIHALFSREAVLGGSLEKLEKKRAKDAVDDGLLEDISGWRDLLAKNIANRNKLSEERLNRIVQDTIGRLLFLRICEDRGIAHEGDLREVAERDGNYAKLYKLFKKAEQRYDSDLFEVASISDLVVDDKVLKEIISELYFPKSPYKFDAIPAEILGQVYEQFLGKVIRLTGGGHAKVEEKPEVRKAGGIYYTPAYIVEYIVRNTVGKLVEGKTPKKIESLSIVDPACGSGSFLLGAYKFLVDWYRDWYVADGPEKHQKSKKIYLDADKQWQLTLDERKRILTAHIYGVDLDRQAVEMAKLSLMLEALRAPEQQSLFNDRMLPRMGDNIKCGNALVGTDYFKGSSNGSDDEWFKINPFNWNGKDGFSEIMNRGGFDVVIGNPPYIFGEHIDEGTKIYYEEKYAVAEEQYDLYQLFIERGLGLVKLKGWFSYIVPDALLARDGVARIRRMLLDAGLQSLYHCGPVFDAAVSATVFCVNSGNLSKKIRSEINRDDDIVLEHLCSRARFEKDDLKRFLIHASDEEDAIIKSVIASSSPLSAFVTLSRGEELGKSSISNTGRVPIIVGEDISRYHIDTPSRFIRKAKKNVALYKAPKIVIVKTGRYCIAALDSIGQVTMQSVYNVHRKSSVTDLNILLSILNSRLVRFYIHKTFTAYKLLFPQMNQTNIEEIPIKKVVKETDKKTTHVAISRNAQLMCVLQHRLKNTQSEQVGIALKRRVEETDREIDHLVYKLYGLTNEDIRLVEEATK